MNTYAILPYRELLTIAEETVHEYNLKVPVLEGHVEEAIPAAVDAERHGAELIISRGGTAEIIRRHVHVPVVSIRVSDINLLNILYPLRGMNRNILVVGFRNAVARTRAVAEILGLNIQELSVPYEQADYNFDSVKYAAEGLIKKYGIDTIIGDQTAYLNLQSFCESQFLIKSSKDDFIETLEMTKIGRAATAQDSLRNIQTALDSVSDIVVSTDCEGIITIYNRNAENFFNIPSISALGSNIREIIGRESPLYPITENLTDVLHTKSSIRRTIDFSPRESLIINGNPLHSGEATNGVVFTINSASKNKVSTKQERKKVYQSGFTTKYSFDDISTEDPVMRKMKEIARGYASTDATVLIEGESGVGKELFAQSIHAASPRKNRSFVAVNCAAFPSSLLESELFGYEKGAFTGAGAQGKPGLFEIANYGTIFLDEIGEIDRNTQVRFLRVLEEKQIMRLGSDRVIDLDVRVIVASNRNLRELVEDKLFRADLYYRINLLRLDIPPLRKRAGDIWLIADSHYRSVCERYGIESDGLPQRIRPVVNAYSWPGNIRELKNVVERVALTIGAGCLDPDNIELIAEEFRECIGTEEDDIADDLLTGNLEEIKRKAVLHALKAENYNKSRAARRLGINRSTIDRLIE